MSKKKKTALMQVLHPRCHWVFNYKNYWTCFIVFCNLHLMGMKENGYYGMVFQVYNLALMLTSYSLPTAVSKLVSARVATGQYHQCHRVFRG